MFDVTPNNGSANDWDAVNEDWQNSLDAAGQRQGGNVNVLRHDGSVSSESADDLITDNPASSPDDWVPWRLNGTKWVGSSDPEADIDRDRDGIANDQDNCPDQYNPSQGPCEEESEEPDEEDTGEEPPGEEASGCSPGTEVLLAEPTRQGNWQFINDHKANGSHDGDGDDVD
ncbi:MAG: hypothetical protein GY888_11245, partial [Planctomycetaceae bacterium]|nr:hypothetical protein [Planctomycetaceae bacterium]